MRLKQRGNSFVGEVQVAPNFNLGQVGAVGGEGDDRGVGDVALAEANISEGRAPEIDIIARLGGVVGTRLVRRQC